MKLTGRLQIYPPAGPRKSGYVVADRAALKGLAEAIKSASTSTFGFETVKLYSADGHEYELVITSSVTDEEWQAIPPNYAATPAPQIETLQNYQDLKDQLSKT
jgi:hypothetical protein